MCLILRFRNDETNRQSEKRVGGCDIDQIVWDGHEWGVGGKGEGWGSFVIGFLF